MKNSSNNNSRVVINHNYDEFEEGNEYILTLDDKPILAKTDELNDGNQLELSNTLLASKRPPKDGMKNKNGKEINSKDYQQNKLNTSIKPFESNNGKDKDLEEVENKIILNSEGSFDINKKDTLDRIKNRLAYKNKGTNLETPKIFASDFEAKDTSIFKRPGKIRKKIFDDNILESLEKTSSQNEKDQAKQISKEIKQSNAGLSNIEKEKAENKLAYNIALKKAEIENDMALKGFKNDEEEYENEIRKQIASKLRTQKKFELNAETLKKYDSQDLEKAEEKQQEMTLVEETGILIKNIESKKDLLEVKMKYQNSKFSVKDSKAGVESIVNIPLYSELIINQQRNIENPNDQLLNKVKDVSLFPMNSVDKNGNENENENENEKNQKSNNQEEKEKEKEKSHPLEKNDNFSKEPLAGRGIASSIVIFRNRGMLKRKEIYSIDYDKDNTERNLLRHSKKSNKAYDYSHIEIVHRDKEGNIQTPKEAFVEQSRFYHSLGPSKKKQEKIILKKRKELEKKRTDQVEDSLFLKALQKNQEKTKQPHLILSSKSHTIL